MATINEDKKKRIFKIIDIASWIIIILLFVLSLFGIIVKFNKGTVYIFDYRYDVVLTKSMSAKNEEHLDFLKGHDDQIQPFDLVRAKKVNAYTDLNVYDIVLFKNPYIKGTDMHRIVDKKIKSQNKLILVDAQLTKINNKNAIVLRNHNSSIGSTVMEFTTIEAKFYSENEEFSNGYQFAADSTILTPKEITTTKEGKLYCHKVVIDKGSSRPQKFTILHNKIFDYSSEFLGSVNVDTSIPLKADSTKFKPILGEEDNYEYIAYTQYSYEIRGDLAKDSDGWYTIDQIYAKVTNTIPRGGYFIRYISSVPGMIMMIGSGVLLIILDFVYDKFIKAKPKNAEEETTTTIEEIDNNEKN